MQVLDSRRLTGANLISHGPGAILDIKLGAVPSLKLVEAWEIEVRKILNGVGWAGETSHWRSYADGVHLVITAPLDALYAATEVNEWAFQAAEASLTQQAPPDFHTAVVRLRELIQKERNPRLLALSQGADQRGFSFLSDDEQVSVGSGRGSVTWAVDRIPLLEEISWDKISEIPIALITGTNGKTTTVRLLAAMAHGAGLQAGVCSTDWIRVGAHLIDTGDYAGPGGARTILRDPRVEVAFLETARGGILRRGLALNRCDVALVTNVAEDHLGEYGIENVSDLCQVKLVVAKAVKPGGSLVVNADDDKLVAQSSSLAVKKFWFSMDPQNPVVRDHLTSGGEAAFVLDGQFALGKGSERHLLLPLSEAPVTLGGAALHNVANGLAAVAVARAMGFSHGAIASGLRHFDNSAQSNPGRSNLYRLGAVNILLDFAHNPHGMVAIAQTVAAMPAKRRLILVGQAGDRDDRAICELAANAWLARPDKIVLKEMNPYLRGRAPGEIPAMMTESLLKAGAPEHVIQRSESEMAAVRYALGWCRPGDLLVLLMHGDREEAMALLEDLKAKGWEPGDALPAQG